MKRMNEPTERDVDEDFAIACFKAAGYEVESHAAVLRFKKNRVILNLWIEGDGSRSWSLESGTDDGGK